MTCTDFYPEYEGKCDVCGSSNLKFAWKREFNKKEHGWSGYHAFYDCLDCGRGNFEVFEDE